MGEIDLLLIFCFFLHREVILEVGAGFLGGDKCPHKAEEEDHVSIFTGNHFFRNFIKFWMKNALCFYY